MLTLQSVTKSFPGVRALDDVSLEFAPGEIHALVGENGAGKSTLIKIITGIYRPDAGEIHFEGEQLQFRGYRDSLQKGIDIVHQEIEVIPESSIAENIMLDKMITFGPTGIINWPAVHRVAAKYMAMVGLDLSPTHTMKHLSAAQKQLAQIAKALAANARVLLLDEPTSSLTEHEAQNLFTLLRDLRDRGVIIVFVSHKFEEVFALCDKASVLRDGHHVATRAISDLTQGELVTLMIGRPHALERPGSLDVDSKDEVLRVEGLTRRDKIDDVNFRLCKGEILGFYGLVGAGRTETARLLMGEDHPDSGRIFIHGNEVKIRHISDALNKYRMGYVTENRKEEGLLLEAPVETNITITVWRRLTHWLTRYINRKQEVAVASDMIDALSIRTTGLAQKTGDLSGGNQQKISIAKWLAADCEILIIDEPTVGVDVGAKTQIHQLIWDLADKSGKSIILISSDMPEIITLASRILVFREGTIVGEITDINNKTYQEASAAIGEYLA